MHEYIKHHIFKLQESDLKTGSTDHYSLHVIKGRLSLRVHVHVHVLGASSVVPNNTEREMS